MTWDQRKEDPVTFDQLTNLLAVLVWPAVAAIASTALVHVTRLIVDAVADLRRGLGHWALAIIREITHRDTVAADPTLTRTVHDAAVAILAAQGGIPSAGPGDQFGRALVREIRNAYKEIDRPTPAPARRNPDDGMGGARAASVSFDDFDPHDADDLGDGEYAELIEEEDL